MDLVALKQDLSKQRELLRGRVSRIERDLRRPHDPDSAERATERLNEPVLEALDDHVLAEIEALDAALRRIDQGSFGSCGNCGGAISEARLKALPITTTCIDCAD